MTIALLCGSHYLAQAEAPGELREAVQRGDAASLERLLAGAPADRREADAATTLIWSAHYGRTDLLHALLTHGVPATAADARGWTALMAAVKGNQSEAVDILLKHGADPDARPKDGVSSAAMLATELGRTAIIERLRQRSGAAAPKAAQETLASALQNGRLDMIKTLPANPGFRVSGPAGQKALLLAIQQQDTATARALLDRGAKDAGEGLQVDGDLRAPCFPCAAAAIFQAGETAARSGKHGARRSPSTWILFRRRLASLNRWTTRE